jgi:predicted transcriptional regulator
LLSIKPQYSSAIFRGEKRFEFRRSIFSRPVDVVVVYATAPVQRGVGEFDVHSILSESLSSLWEQTKWFAGVEEDFFFRYFEGRNHGYAIEVGEVRAYQSRFCPVKRFGIRPPQAFVYLDSIGLV